MAVAVAVCAGAFRTAAHASAELRAGSPQGRKVVLTISADIDGRSVLHIDGKNAYWVHDTQAAPGRHNGADAPTQIGKKSWVPSWPRPGENRDCGGCKSSVFHGVTPALPKTGPITFTAVSCREKCSGTAGGGQATIVFDDDASMGDAVYVATLTFYVPRPAASLGVEVSAPANVPAGRVVDVTAKVTAKNGSVGSISLGKGLVTSNDDAVVTVSPAGLSGFSLAKNASRSFTFKVKGVKDGISTLSVAAAGKAGSKEVSASGHTELKVVPSGSVAITFEAVPKKIELELGKDGNVLPGKETVKVVVTNNSEETVTNVRLETLGAEPVDPTQQLDPIRFPKNTIPVRFQGAFAPRSQASRTFTLEVTGDGEYRFRSLALYDDPSRPGGNGRAVGVGGEFEAVAPLLSFTADLHRDNITQRNGADWVKGGDSWYVGGRIKNLSTHQSLCLAPIFAQEDGNAVSAGLQDVSLNNANVEEPPLAGLIKPGQSFPLGMLVRTSSTGATRSTVDVTVKAFKAQSGASCQVQLDGSLVGAGAALTPDQMEIQKDSTSYVVHVDVSVNPDPVTRSGYVNFFGGFAKGSFEFYSGIAQSLGAVAKWASSNPATYFKLVRASSGDPAAAADLLSRNSEHMMALTSLIVHYLETVVPTTGDNPFQIAAQTWQHAGNDAYARIGKASAEWSKHWTDELEHDYANGSAEDIWRDYAGIAGEGVGQLQAVALQLFVEKLFAGMATTKASQLEAAAGKVTDAEKVVTTSKGGAVVAGRVLSAADEEQGWGITEAIAKKLRDIAQKYDVLIGARSRQTISIELERLGAVLKNSNFHQKTVSAIDRDWLQMTVRQGLLGFRGFTEDGIAYARELIETSTELDATQKLEALKRLDGRIAENGSDFHHIEELVNWEHRACSTCPTQKGWVNAGFNASDSGAAAGRTSTSRWRRFTVKETPIKADGKILGTQYVPYEESPNLAHLAKDPAAALPELCIRDLGTVLCPITGDIDLVYIVNKYGGSLTPEQMYKVFKALDDAGFAHTDLVTWVEQLTNNYYFPGKSGQLSGLLAGAESTIQYAPDGIDRATYLAPLDQSIAIGPNNFQLSIEAGYFPDMR